MFFRDAKNPEDELNAWAFWHQRQPTNKQRIIDAETNNLSEECGIVRIEDLAYNAISVYWSPLQKPAFISLAIQCLSTDFSLQKGVKGLPMHLQIDTYVRSGGEGGDFDDLVHRGYCQVKVFCDKGAERKFRQEERRASRKVAAGGQRVLDMYHQCQERSDFYSMVDMGREPVLYTPSAVTGGGGTAAGLLTPPPPAAGFLTSGGSNSPALSGFPATVSSVPTSPGQSLLKQNGGSGSLLSAADYNNSKRRKTLPPPETRMVVYVRQENEEIFTPLHLVPPTVPGRFFADAYRYRYGLQNKCARETTSTYNLYNIDGGRIIDNLQIDNLQIDNRQIDNRQIDNLANFRQIDNRQIDNLSFSKKITNYKLLTEKLQTCHFRQIVDLQNCNLNFI